MLKDYIRSFQLIASENFEKKACYNPKMIDLKVILCVSIAASVFFVQQCRPANAEEVEEIFVPDPNIDYYSLAYVNLDIKPIVDNRRLFKKYKYCILAEKPKGCPRNVLAMRCNFFLLFF